jgi:hypothetical protein
LKIQSGESNGSSAIFAIIGSTNAGKVFLAMPWGQHTRQDIGHRIDPQHSSYRQVIMPHEPAKIRTSGSKKVVLASRESELRSRPRRPAFAQGYGGQAVLVLDS